MSSYYKRKIAIFTLLSILIPNLVYGAEVDYNHIISDQEAEDYQSMTMFEIRDFLRSQNSYLADYEYSGNNPSLAQLALDPAKKYIQTRGAAEIIYNAAQEAKINPQFLLTLLQKEQGLIENSDPSERNLNFAMGYYCYDGNYCNVAYKGFGKQIRGAALQFRWYMDNIYSYNWQPNKAACADDPNTSLPCTSKGTVVTPANKITAAMYIYTPHLHGNKLFFTLWNKYGFGGEIDEVENDIPVVKTGFFPEGALVKAKDSEAGTIYLISNEQKRAFANMNALVSRFDPDKVLLVDQKDLANYDNGPVIAHANYSVLEDLSAKRYLIDGVTKRLITSDEAFRQLGYSLEEIEKVSDTDLNAYQTGEPLDESSSPFAELWKDMTSAEVYLVKDGQKHTIIDQFILNANFADMKIKEVTAKTLENLSSGTPIKLLDGTLIKKDLDARVYVISNGQRRLISDGATFEKLGYNWSQIYTVSSKIMNFHVLGEPILSQE
ncbi:MAG: hypothetical protein WCS88_02990 [Patescibacteria group bacterium]|jgi:hypothetical protein